MAALKIPTLPFLAWAIWALILPVTMAHHHRVKWEDLMVATNKFPRFFGEAPSISRTGSPRVVGIGYKHGSVVEPAKCSGANAEEMHCELDCGHCMLVGRKFLIAIDHLQRLSPPQLNELTFITSEYTGIKWVVGKQAAWHRHLWFNQTNLGGTIAIDNSRVQLNLVSQ